jgi:hypothetical protein
MRRSLRNALLGAWLLSSIGFGWWIHDGDGRGRSKPPGAHSQTSVAAPVREDAVIHSAVGSARGVIQVNPRHADYDAVRVGVVLDLSAQQLFAGEPRVADWAERVESQERAQVESSRNVFPSIQVEEVECRTATCRTTISLTPAELDEMLQYIQMFVPLGEVVSFDILDDGAGADRAHVAWFSEFSPQYRDVDAVKAELQRRFPQRAEARDAWIAERDQRKKAQK